MDIRGFLLSKGCWITLLLTFIMVCYPFINLIQLNLGSVALARGAVSHDPLQLATALQILRDQPGSTLLRGEQERLLGLALLFQQAEDEATEQFKVAQQMGNFSAQANLGILYLQQEKWQEAVAELNERVCPDYLCIDRYVTKLLEEGKKQEAIELLTAYITTYPEATSTPYYRLFGQHWGSMPDEELHSLLSRGLSIDQEKDSVTYFYYSALLQSLEGNDSEAIHLLQNVIRIEPAYYAALHLLGQLYLRSGELQPAIETFELALKVEPNREWSYHYLASAYLQAGRESEAIEAVWEALLLSPHNPMFLDRLIQLYKQVKQTCFEEGLQQLKQKMAVESTIEIQNERLGLVQRCQL